MKWPKVWFENGELKIVLPWPFSKLIATDRRTNSFGWAKRFWRWGPLEIEHEQRKDGESEK